MKKGLFLVLTVFFAFHISYFSLAQKGNKLAEKINLEINWFESLAKPARNSPGFLVIEKSVFLEFKDRVNKSLIVQDSLLSLNNEQIIVQDSAVKRKELSKFSTVDTKNQPSKDLSLRFDVFNLPIWLVISIVLFFVYTIFISLKFYTLFSKEISIQEQLEVVTTDFESYKKSTIVRERKLLRDLIDAKNKMEDFENQHKKILK